METWIDKDWMPQLIWENGPSDREARADLLAKTYLPDVYGTPPDKNVLTDKKQFDEANKAWQLAIHQGVIKQYQGPTVQIHGLKLEPILDQWPPRSHTELYGDESFSDQEVESLLHRFAERAFRRPVTIAEIQPYIDLVKSQLHTQPEVPAGGIKDLIYRVYDGKWTKLPVYDELKPVKLGQLAEGLIDIRVAGKPDYYGVVFEAFSMLRWILSTPLNSHPMMVGG